MSQPIQNNPNANPNAQGGFDIAFDEGNAPASGVVTGSDQADKVTNNNPGASFQANLGNGNNEYTGAPGGPGTQSGTSSVSSGSGNDFLQAGSGESADFSAGDGDDELVGSIQNDNLSGEGGDDTLKGGVGDDTLDGGTGDDELFGGPGRDTLTGQAGDDTLDGGAGRDTLTGGPGADTFSFEVLADVNTDAGNGDASDVFAGGDQDVITDFNPEEDTLQFDESFFGEEQGEFFVTEDGDDAIISFGESEENASKFLRLEDTDAENVDPDDFEIL